ncbi:MAG: ABC transporter ATP-binding protein [Lachnospiraceae bacterium]|nr:ABC transporter ATP-binding protein [Lachnospiraceae bacterium]
MVNLDKVSKFIISDFSFHVPAGECVGIIGASGAGKTTLLKLICGLLEPEKGYVRILGKEPIAEKQHYGKKVSAFFAGRWAFEDSDTVKQAFEMLRVVYHLPVEEFEAQYRELSQRLSFEEYEDKALKSLSLGQRMRAELAGTLIGNPRLILLDEPGVGLDENGKMVLWELIQQRCRSGATVLIASHSLSELSRICTRMVLLEKGKLLYYGSEKYLLNKYAAQGTIELTVSDGFPDLEDLPVRSYEMDGQQLRISYNINHLSAAEILNVILSQSRVEEVIVKRPELADIILRMKGEKGYESD